MEKKAFTSDVRERIVDTASRLFYAQGYNLTGINQVIAEAGVAKASLYQHFPSKDDLLQAYLLKAGREWMDTLEQKAATLHTPKEKVLLAFDLFSELTKSFDYRGCNFQNIVTEVPQENIQVSTIIKKQKDRMRAFFKYHLTILGKPELSDEIFILFEGACIVSQMYGSTWSLETGRQLADRMI
ncbi:MAG: TetR family transcriptional regulator [Bacteroidetes bacterium]|nr:TetR family transcriptional regulator [Bacteroidota bacterium]